MDRSLRLGEAILKGWPSLSPGLVRGTTSHAPTLGQRQSGSTLNGLHYSATAGLASTLSRTSAKVDRLVFSKPEACDNLSRWSSARSARHHRSRPSGNIPRRGITLCATPIRGRHQRRLLSGGIACRLNHRLRLLHSSGMLRTRIKRLSQGDLPGLYVSQATQSSRCCANNGLTDCSPVGADISLNWHLMD